MCTFTHAKKIGSFVRKRLAFPYASFSLFYFGHFTLRFSREVVPLRVPMGYQNPPKPIEPTQPDPKPTRKYLTRILIGLKIIKTDLNGLG